MSSIFFECVERYALREKSQFETQLKECRERLVNLLPQGEGKEYPFDQARASAVIFVD